MFVCTLMITTQMGISIEREKDNIDNSQGARSQQLHVGVLFPEDIWSAGKTVNDSQMFVCLVHGTVDGMVN